MRDDCNDEVMVIMVKSYSGLCVCVYLVDLVCSRVFANSDGERGFVGHGYSQLHIRHAIIVLGHEKERQTAR